MTCPDASDALLHVAARAEFEAASGADHYAPHYAPSAYEHEGFVHCCTPEQLPGVLERYFRGRDDLLLLELDPTALDAPLVYEDTTGRGEAFPHLYGPVLRLAVRAQRALTVDAAGGFDLVEM